MLCTLSVGLSGRGRAVRAGASSARSSSASRCGSSRASSRKPAPSRSPSSSATRPRTCGRDRAGAAPFKASYELRGAPPEEVVLRRDGAARAAHRPRLHALTDLVPGARARSNGQSGSRRDNGARGQRAADHPTRRRHCPSRPGHPQPRTFDRRSASSGSIGTRSSRRWPPPSQRGVAVSRDDRAHQPRRRGRAAEARAAAARGRRHRVTHRRRPAALSRQVHGRRQRPARVRLQLHQARHRQEPQLRASRPRTGAPWPRRSKLFTADACRQPYAPARSHLVVSPENARAMLSRVHQGRAKELCHLRSQGPRSGDGQAAQRAGQGGCRRPRHRRHEGRGRRRSRVQAGHAAARARDHSRRHCARSSAARACGRRSSRAGARWDCWSTTRRSRRNCSRSSRPTGGTGPGSRPPEAQPVPVEAAC